MGNKTEGRVSISKEDFERFIEVRNSGRVNMWSCSVVGVLACITKEQVQEICFNFGLYADKWPEAAKRR